MKTYEITLNETIITIYRVKAKSKEEAERLFFEEDNSVYEMRVKDVDSHISIEEVL